MSNIIVKAYAFVKSCDVFYITFADTYFATGVASLYLTGVE
jgi:hypothetical protein